MNANTLREVELDAENRHLRAMLEAQHALAERYRKALERLAKNAEHSDPVIRALGEHAKEVLK